MAEALSPLNRLLKFRRTLPTGPEAGYSFSRSGRTFPAVPRLILRNRPPIFSPFREREHHDLIEQAAKGHTHIITLHDQPWAQLGPAQSPARKLTDEWRERVKKRNIRLNSPGKSPLTISQLIQASRK